MKYYLTFFNKLVRTGFWVFILLAELAAQQDDPQMRLAQELEHNQHYESALEVYRLVYTKYPPRLDIIRGIKRCSIALQKYDELISFYEDLIRRNPPNSAWVIDLAEIYYLDNQRQKATDLWWTEIKKDPQNISIYRMVGAAMITQRLYDEAIRLYQEAMRQVERQSNLYIDIGNLFRQQLEYDKAVENYLQYYAFNPKQKSFLQRQVLNLSNDQNQTKAVIRVLETYIAAHPEQRDVKEILGGLYLKEKNFEPAFGIYKALDTKDTRGQYLMNFASEAYHNQAYQEAITAYRFMREKYPDSPFILQSIFETGRTHYAMADLYRENSDLHNAAQAMAGAVLIFDSLAADPKKSDFHTRSLVLLGDIYYDFYFDLDQAIQYYQRYLQSERNSINRDQALLKLGDVYLCKNQPEKARTAYQQVSPSEYKSIAKFKIAEMTYFLGNPSAARELLSELIPGLPSTNPLLNDVLSRSMVIQSHIQDSLALVSYAHAELLVFQRRLSEAIEILNQLVADHSSLSALAGRQAARLLLKLEKPSEARLLLFKIYALNSEDLYLDETIFLLAQVEEKEGNDQQALEYYQQILSGFPTSLYLQQARENARRLTARIKKDQS